MKDQEKARLLIADDDDALTELMQEFLGMHLFELSRVASGDAVVEAIAKTQPHLLILDLMLPGMNGLDVCRQIRDDYSGAILMLTASQSEADHVAGLELGADDFVTKPIEPRVLLARIRTQLRRLQIDRAPLDADLNGLLSFGPLEVDISSRSVQVDGAQVPLTTMEYDIFAMLAKTLEVWSNATTFTNVLSAPSITASTVAWMST